MSRIFSNAQSATSLTHNGDDDSTPFYGIDTIWYTSPVEAQLLLRERFVYADGAIREMVLWRIPDPSPDRPHALKYRLFYGNAQGRCAVRYDNETGKGDHRHYADREEPYTYVSVEQLVGDFFADIDAVRGGEA